MNRDNHAGYTSIRMYAADPLAHAVRVWCGEFNDYGVAASTRQWRRINLRLIGKQETPLLVGDDIVCPVWKHAAGARNRTGLIEKSQSNGTTDQVDIGFDGDEVNQFLHIDRIVSEEMINLAPHKSAFNFSGVREVSVNISMPKPVIATIAAFIKRNDEPIDLERRARAEAFFA